MRSASALVFAVALLLLSVATRAETVELPASWTSSPLLNLSDNTLSEWADEATGPMGLILPDALRRALASSPRGLPLSTPFLSPDRSRALAVYGMKYPIPDRAAGRDTPRYEDWALAAVEQLLREDQAELFTIAIALRIADSESTTIRLEGERYLVAGAARVHLGHPAAFARHHMAASTLQAWPQHSDSALARLAYLVNPRVLVDASDVGRSFDPHVVPLAGLHRFREAVFGTRGNPRHSRAKLYWSAHVDAFVAKLR